MNGDQIKRLFSEDDRTNRITHRIDVKNGKVQLVQLGTTGLGHQEFSDPSEFLKYIHSTGLTKREEFLGSRTRGNHLRGVRPQNGPLYYDFLEQAAIRGKLDIVREAYHLDRTNIGEYKSRFTKGNKVYGIHVTDQDVNTVVRVFKGGKELDTQSAMKALGLEMDVDNTKDFARSSKRLKALFSERGYATSLDRKLKVNTAAWNDLSSMFPGMTEEAALRSKDGIAIINPKVARAMAQNLKKRADEEGIKLAGKRTAAAVKGRREVKKMHAAAKQLHKAINEGGVFNMRAMGLNVGKGQIKGNVLIGSKAAFAKGGKFFGSDIVVHESGITKQLSFADHMNGWISLDARKSSKGIVFSDIQSMMAHRNLYDVNNILEYNDTQFQRFIEDLNGSGTHGKVEAFIESLREILEREKPSNMSTDEFLEKQSYARSVIDYVDQGLDARTSPVLKKAILDSYVAWMESKDRYGNPIFRAEVPDAMRGYIIDQHTVNQSGLLDKPLRLAKNQVTFRPNIGWILEQNIPNEFYHSFGGWDLDDALTGRLVWDNKGKGGYNLKLLSFRSPTAAGEFGVFNIAEDDIDTLKHVFKLKGMDTVAAQLQNLHETMLFHSADGIHLIDASAKRAWQKARIEKRNLIKEHIRRIDDINEFMSLRREDKLSQLDRALTIAPFELKKKIMDVSGIRLGRQQMVVAERMAQAKPILGMLENVHMLVYYLNNQFGDQLATIPKKGKYANPLLKLDTESIIDAVINPDPRAVAKLENTEMPRIERALGELLAVARAKGIDIGLDQLLVEQRLKNKANVAAGLADAAARLGLSPEDHDLSAYLLGREDERAIWSRAVHARQLQIEAAKEIARKEVAKTPWIKEAIEGVYTPEEIESAQRVLSAFDEAMGDQITDTPGDLLELMAHKQDPFRSAHRAAAIAMAENFEDGKAGNKAFRVIGALMQITHNEGRDWNVLMGRTGKAANMADLTNVATARMLTGGNLKKIHETHFPGLTRDQLKHLRRMHAKEISVGDFLPEGYVPGAKKAAVKSMATGAARKMKDLTRISKDELWKVWDVKAVNRGAMIAAGLIGFSFLFQSQKDVTPEDASGPDFLPGGSFYEGMYTDPMPDMGYSRGSSSGQGVTYRVRGSGGNVHSDTLLLQAEMLTGAPATGSMYNASPGFEDIFSIIDQDYRP